MHTKKHLLQIAIRAIAEEKQVGRQEQNAKEERHYTESDRSTREALH